MIITSYENVKYVAAVGGSISCQEATQLIYQGVSITGHIFKDTNEILSIEIDGMVYKHLERSVNNQLMMEKYGWFVYLLIAAIFGISIHEARSKRYFLSKKF